MAHCWCDTTDDYMCGETCVNRLLFQECSDETCRNADCTNRQFSNRLYARTSVRDAGVRGLGLFTDEDLGTGVLVTEYTGEVITMDMYTQRRHSYVLDGIQHSYAMHFDNGLVIDSTNAGNFGRFVNHSCKPNCHIQKWCVRGRTVIGIFTTTPVDKNEELTIEYNFGMNVKIPCFCQSGGCRGVLGRPSTEPIDKSMTSRGSRIESPQVDETFHIAHKFLGILPRDVISNSNSVAFVRLVRILFGKIVVDGKYVTDSQVLGLFVQQFLENEVATSLELFVERFRKNHYYMNENS